MLGLLLVVVLSLAFWAGGYAIWDRFGPQEAIFGEKCQGSLILGLGTFGWLTWMVSLVSTKLIWIVPLVAIGLFFWFKPKFDFSTIQPEPKWWLPVFFLILLLPVINALAPSDMMDWDSLAYHLAVPKLWLEAGRVTYIPFIHHSNFPFCVDSLYLYGLSIGSESGAKGMTVMFYAAGAMWLLSVVRRWSGNNLAGILAAIGFMTMPVVMWESGSGYIDVAHGLFATIAILSAAEVLKTGDRRWLFLCAWGLGLAMASKYTGLLTAVAVGLVLTIGAFRSSAKDAWRPAVMIFMAFAVLSGPFLVRNVVNTKNPTYPFLYGVFGGENWDTWRESVYKNEQRTFGMKGTLAEGDSAIPTLGQSVLGLTFQPGRYINPQQTLGGGFPMGAIGVIGAVGAMLWLVGGARGRRERAVFAIVAVHAAGWFFLSEQSRYAVSFVVPLVALGAAACVTKRSTLTLFSVLVAGQGFYTLWLIQTAVTSGQVRVAFGQEDRDEYRANRVPLAKIAPEINTEVGDGRVAMYDEVFGYLLDCDYLWANPGHSKIIAYETSNSGADLVESLKENKVTHILYNGSYAGSDVAQSIVGGSIPLTAESNLDLKWRMLLSDAIRNGLVEPAAQEGRIFLWRIR
jgi:4-amino-4-deoxy-L-arabinose transferase-like glycosyltransferase